MTTTKWRPPKPNVYDELLMQLETNSREAAAKIATTKLVDTVNKWQA